MNAAVVWLRRRRHSPRLWRDRGGRDGDRGCAEHDRAGLKELAQDEPSERVRRPGAGRKPTISKVPTLLGDLEALVEPTTRGDRNRLSPAMAQGSKPSGGTLARPLHA